MTIEVPIDQWSDYLESISAEYQGRPVTVHIENPEVGNQVLVRGVPLIGIEPDLRQDTIILILADPEGADPEGIRHFITAPTAIFAKQDDQGNTQVVDFQSQDEGKTLLSLL